MSSSRLPDITANMRSERSAIVGRSRRLLGSMLSTTVPMSGKRWWFYGKRPIVFAQNA